MATLRLPRMSEQFRKAIRRKSKPETFQRHEQESIATLSKYIDEQNEDKFYEEFLQKVQEYDSPASSKNKQNQGKYKPHHSRNFQMKATCESPAIIS